MYQISLEDIEKLKHIGSQPSRTAFIDECGGFGFDFTEPGTSKYYIICAICVKDSKIDNLQQAIEKVRGNYFGTGEMKSSTIGNDYKRRSKIIAELMPLEFRAVILVANKQAFIDGSPLTSYKKSFIKFLHQRLYNVLYHVYPKLKLLKTRRELQNFKPDLKNMYRITDHNTICLMNMILILRIVKIAFWYN